MPRPLPPPTVRPLRVAIYGTGLDAEPALAAALHGAPFEATFLDGAAPYQRVRLGRPDVVFICFVPDAEGACDLLTRLKADPFTAGIPVFAGDDRGTCFPLETRSAVPRRRPSREVRPCAVK